MPGTPPATARPPEACRLRRRRVRPPCAPLPPAGAPRRRSPPRGSRCPGQPRLRSAPREKATRTALRRRTASSPCPQSDQADPTEPAHRRPQQAHAEQTEDGAAGGVDRAEEARSRVPPPPADQRREHHRPTDRADQEREQEGRGGRDPDAAPTRRQQTAANTRPEGETGRIGESEDETGAEVAADGSRGRSRRRTPPRLAQGAEGQPA